MNECIGKDVLEIKFSENHRDRVGIESMDGTGSPDSSHTV